MKTKNLAMLMLLLLSLVLLWGCEPDNPGSPYANQPPETRIVVAPLADSEHDHFVSPSVMFHVQWFGYDSDGRVVGYWIRIDDDPEVWTTRSDSAIAFTSAIQDPDDPARLLENHTIKVAAVDNQDLRDSSPAMRTFNAVNYAPRVTGFDASFLNDAVVGPGITFGVTWDDENPSGAMFRLNIDNSVFTEWDTRNFWQFCDTGDSDIMASVDQGAVMPVDISILPAGQHSVTVEIKDMGEAIGTPRTRTLTVIDTVAPSMTDITSTYGTADYYPDGSIFYQPRTQTLFAMEGSADSYFGSVHSYRFRKRFQEIGSDDWTEWSDWSDWGLASVEFSNLAIGEHQFQSQCRDFAGILSDTLEYSLTIVEPDYGMNTILLVDETKNGNGNPGSPSDFQSDEFWRYVLDISTDVVLDTNLVDNQTWMNTGGWEVTELHYDKHQINGVSYVSAKDVFNKRVIIWHGDDRSQVFLGENERILQEFLSSGGRLIISGWDVLSAFTDETTIDFTSGFAYNYLRIAGGKKNGDKDFIGMMGNVDLGYATVNLDPAKLPNSWAGVNNCWQLTPRHRAESIGNWIAAEDDSEFAGLDCAIRNFSPVVVWKTVVLGYPLYFMNNDEAKEFVLKMLEDINI